MIIYYFTRAEKSCFFSKQPRAYRVAFIRPLKGGKIKEKAAVKQQRLA
jgi:hypothetical protein